MKIYNEVKIGIITFFALLCFILGYSFLKGSSVFSRETVFYVLYENTNGIAIAKPVQINGFKIGRVSDMELTKDRKILVTITIDSKYKIPQNSVAKIHNTTILGDKSIIIDLGNSSSIAKSGTYLLGDTELSLFDDISPIKDKSAQILIRVDSILSFVNKNILNSDFQKNFNNSFARIASILRNIDSTSRSISSESARLSRIFGNVESITEDLKSNTGSMGNIVSNIDSFALSLSRSPVEKTVSEVYKLVQKVNNESSTLGALINDKELYNNLNGASVNLNKLLIDLRTNPKRYVHFSIFGGGSGSKEDKKENPAPGN